MILISVVYFVSLGGCSNEKKFHYYLNPTIYLLFQFSSYLINYDHCGKLAFTGMMTRRLNLFGM